MILIIFCIEFKSNLKYKKIRKKYFNIFLIINLIMDTTNNIIKIFFFHNFFSNILIIEF